MQQIYRRTPVLKCDLIKLKSNFIEISLRHVCFLCCIFSEHFFLRKPMEGCFWNIPFESHKLHPFYIGTKGTKTGMVNQKVAFSKATDTHLCEVMSLVIVITIVTRHLFMNILVIILIEKLRR